MGRAIIEHADTGQVYAIDGVYLKFESIDMEQESIGTKTMHYATIQHPQLGELNWSFREHTDMGNNRSYSDAGSHKIIQDFWFKFYLDDFTEEERQDRIKSLIRWFEENYQDPAESLYHESKEGGYHGDIRDASDELQENFPDEPYDIIEEALKKIESYEGEQWTPIHSSKESLIDELSNLIDTAPVPTTDPAFAFGEDNLLHIIDPPDNQPVDSQNELLNELRRVIDDLSGFFAGHNRYLNFVPIIEKYKEAISGEQISITRLYARGTRLENMAKAINRDIESGEPSLSSNTEECLKTAITLHETYIMLHAEGKRLLEASAAYHRTPEQTQELKTAGEQFANSIVEKPDLFGEDVRDHFHDFSSDIGNGQYPERSNQISENTVINFVSSILRWMKSPKGTITSVILGGAVAISTPGKIAITAGANLIDKAWIFLTNSIASIKAFATQSPWLAEVVQLLEYIKPIIGL